MRTFEELALVFEKLEKTSSSLAMVDILADFLKKISPEEGRATAYLLRGQVAPEYQGLELGLAAKLVMRSIARALNLDTKVVESEFKKEGDLGNVTLKLKERMKGQKGLFLEKKQKYSILDVYQKLKEIAQFSGLGSQEKKIDTLTVLINHLSPLEAKYVVRLVLGTLRLGVAEMTFLYALAKAIGGKKEDKKILEKGYNVLSDIGEVTARALREKLKAFVRISPQLFVPTRMMLAERIESLEEIKEHIKGEVLVEYKYDGERAQAHIKKEKIKLFSRRHEEISHQFPELIKALQKNFLGKEGILEGEVVAVDKKTGNLLPFQSLMQRRRKYDIEKYVEKIPVCYFLFDILYFDGKSLLEEKISKRKEWLKKAVKESEELKFADYIVTADLSEIEDFFLTVTKKGAEGVVVKDANSDYEAGKRGWKWIKFKKEYASEMADTFDVVVVGGFFGTGKRKGTFGSLLVAAFDPKTNKYYSLTKVGAGFTDEDLKEIPKKLKPYLVKEKPRLVETEMKPDVWFEPHAVMEISGAEFTISPVHTVAKDKIKKGGLALRFPRFKRWRDDKSAEQATTVEEIFQMYQRKSSK